MEKVVCALWRDPGEEQAHFNARLLASLPQALWLNGVSGLRINLRDGAVDPAASLVQRWQDPQQDAVVQFWLPSANARFRRGLDQALGQHCARFAAWLVAESTVIANTDHPPRAGQRTWGWSQASFITFRADMPKADALKHWHSHHTDVAIATQANFEYVQNAVLCPLTDDAPGYDAFVEECFPPESMTDPAAFFDAVGDPAKLAGNIKAMMGSCQAFLDFSRNDIIPTSQFHLGDKP
ncbi:MAG: hypothetical protein RLZZ136_1675 [Pseudomonadota bacterium]